MPANDGHYICCSFSITSITCYTSCIIRIAKLSPLATCCKGIPQLVYVYMQCVIVYRMEVGFVCLSVRVTKVTLLAVCPQSGQSSRVKQFHITNWSPDGSCSNLRTVTDVIEEVTKIQMRTENKPIVVHCRYRYEFVGRLVLTVLYRITTLWQIK